jgi:hypothetical protein
MIEQLVSQWQQTADAMRWAAELQLEILFAFLEEQGLRDVFQQTATTLGLDPSEVVFDVLLYIDATDLEAKFYAFLLILVEEETNRTEPPLMTSPATSDLETFFDRSLTRRALVRLTPTPIAGPVYELAGHETAKLVVDKAEWGLVEELLKSGLPMANVPAGDIIRGWYCTFADGVVVAVAITNGGRRVYADAFLIPPDGVFLAVPNPSLPPLFSIVDPFMFHYPDGTVRIVKIVPGE